MVVTAIIPEPDQIYGWTPMSTWSSQPGPCSWSLCWCSSSRVSWLGDDCFLENGDRSLGVVYFLFRGGFLLPSPYLFPSSIFSNVHEFFFPWDYVSSLRLGSPHQTGEKPYHSEVFSLGIPSSACPVSHRSILSLYLSTLNRQAECHCALLEWAFCV